MNIPDRIRRHIDSRYDPTADYSVEREVLEFFLDLIENDTTEEELERLREEDELDMTRSELETAYDNIAELENEVARLKAELAAYGLQNHPG